MKNNTALILSSNFITNQTIPTLLREYGITEVFHLTNVTDAMNKAKEVQPEFVFLDYNFLKDNSRTLCIDMISASNSKVIVMAQEEKEDMVRQKLDFDWNSLGFLPTPFSSKEIKQIVVNRYTEHFYGSIA